MIANVTPRKRKAIETLLTTGDNTAAAAAAGVSRNTLYRWMAQSDFQAALHDAEHTALKSLSRSLVVLADSAMQVLQDALTGDGTTAEKIRAADIVLSRLLQLRDLVDWDARLSRVEAIVNDGHQKTIT